MAKKKAKKKVSKQSGRKRPPKKTTGAAGKTHVAPSDPAVGQSDQPEPPRIPKTRLSDDELLEFRDLLLKKRAELVGDVRNMTNEALRDNPPGGSGNLSNVPIHMADVGSDNWEQEFTLGLLEAERELLKEIDAALARIDGKTYGICEATHKPISKRRLRASPWARHCIEYAREKELRRAP